MANDRSVQYLLAVFATLILFGLIIHLMIDLTGSPHQAVCVMHTAIGLPMGMAITLIGVLNFLFGREMPILTSHSLPPPLLPPIS